MTNMEREDIALFCVVLLLTFLFFGEPDVWDALVEACKRWLLKSG